MASNNDNDYSRLTPTWVMVSPDFYISYTADSDPDTGTRVPLEWKCRCGRRGKMLYDDMPCGGTNPDCLGRPKDVFEELVPSAEPV